MKGQQRIMATLDELVQQGKDLKGGIANLATQVDRIPVAIDDLEARVTAAVQAGGISGANQAKIDEAFADAREVIDAVSAATDKLRGAADDAADGTDEATPPTP